MYFYAGFLGVGQDKKSLSLQPVIGWAACSGQGRGREGQDDPEESILVTLTNQEHKV